MCLHNQTNYFTAMVVDNAKPVQALHILLFCCSLPRRLSVSAVRF